MNTGKYIFAQLIEFLPQRIFDRIVMKYEGNKYVKHFTCWNQLLVMMFGQLSNRDSLRDLTSIISAHSNKAYHLGFGKNVTRSNLAKVNERREPRIFEEFAYHMIDLARRKRIHKEFEFVYLTNNMEIPATQVALLYKYRWRVELFFKWIKQHLKIKSFWGTTETDVRIQIYSAITAYCMVAIVEHDLKLHRSTYEVLRILSASLLDNTPIKELFTKEPEYVADDGQLTLNFI